jgi:chorismate mutase
MPSMTFILEGRDRLSRTLDDAGDAALRLARRLDDSARRSSGSVDHFTRDANGRLHDLQGRFVATSSSSDLMASSLGELRKTTLLLAPAAIPAAASLAPIAAGAGTVAVAVAAMGAAIAPQIAQLGEVSEAQKKYDDAVTKSGAHSQEAVQAQTDLARATAKLPPPTREAAAAYAVLKDDYQAWSDSLAGDTMAPLTKGLMLTNALLPKTSGLVRAASGEADRFVTVIGGEMASPGLDRLNGKFTTFAQRTLRSVNDEIVHILRVSDSGQVGGNAREFMQWARAQGPTVASVLSSVASALIHVLKAGSDIGVSLLQVIDVLAGIVSAVPPGAISTFLQLAIALKVTKAAALGLAAGRTVLVGFAAQILAMNSAAAATPGRMAAARASIAALSRTTKIAMAGTGIGLLVIALSELAQRSGQAPPDVDKLTSSLKTLGATGKVTGEAAKHFGSDLSGLHDKVRALTDPSSTDKVQQWIVSLGGLADWDSTPVKEASETIDAIDKSLAALVQNGDADLAAAALKRMTDAYGQGSPKVKAFTQELDDYKGALADSKFEAELAAEAQGVFGMQAMSVQQKLSAQKLSADGLRQSIQALSDTSRNAFDAQTKMEAAIDAVTKSLQENGKTLDAGSDKGRANRDALSQMAAATEDAAAKARENGASWETVNGIYDKGRKTLVDNIAAITGNRREAEALASTLLKMPDKKMRLEMRTEDAVRSLDSVIGAIKKAPDKKSVTVSALTKDAVGMLRDLGFKVERMKDGRFKVTADTKNAKDNIGAVQRARDALKDKSITLSARDRASAAVRDIQAAIAGLRNKSVTITTVRQTIATYSTATRPVTGQGGVSKYAAGGTPEAGEMAMVGENGPELVVFGEAARVFDSTTTKGMLKGTATAGRAAAQGLAVGLGSGGGVYVAARAMAAQVTSGIRDELEIRSPSKKTKALAADVGKGFIVGLTGSRDKIKAVAADLAKDIKTAFSGKKESSLLKMVDQQTKKLLDLAKKRDSVAARIATAKKYAGELTSSAREGAGLSNLGMEPGQVTAGGIKAGLAGKLAQIRTFTRYIDILAKKGLNKGLLRQILNMGPEAGYAYASALVGADKSTFKQINSLQSQLDKSTTDLGRLGADRMYDSGKNASKGFLAGLTSQEKQLEATMVKIAKAMQKSLRKALGIKSPARAMIPDGVNTARGVAVGVMEGLPHVDRAMQAVAGRMAGQAAASPVAGRAAVAARGGGGTVIHIHVDGTVVDQLGFARAARQALLELKRTNGNAALGLV